MMRSFRSAAKPAASAQRPKRFVRRPPACARRHPRSSPLSFPSVPLHTVPKDWISSKSWSSEAAKTREPRASPTGLPPLGHVHGRQGFVQGKGRPPGRVDGPGHRSRFIHRQPPQSSGGGHRGAGILFAQYLQKRFWSTCSAPAGSLRESNGAIRSGGLSPRFHPPRRPSHHCRTDSLGQAVNQGILVKLHGGIGDRRRRRPQRRMVTAPCSERGLPGNLGPLHPPDVDAGARGRPSMSRPSHSGLPGSR